jgi:hypothetical protein
MKGEHLGNGLRIFEDVRAPMPLALVEHEVFTTGAIAKDLRPV